MCSSDLAEVPLALSRTPIQPVVLGSASAVLAAQRELEEEGLRVVAIRAPTVPKGTARLRVALTAAHTESQIDQLAEALGRCCARLRGQGAA